jgi:hypothetical protein
MKKILLLIVMLVCANNLFAQETGKELLEASFKAMGHGKFKDFKTVKVTSSMSQMGMTIPIIMYMKDGNVRLEQTVMGQEIVIVAKKDKDTVSLFQLKPTYQELPFEQSEQLNAQITMTLPNMSDFISDTTDKFELIGEEDFNGKKALKVQITPQTGEPVFVYLDPITKWFVGFSTQGADLIFGGMKKVEGLVYPSNIKMMMNGTLAGEGNIEKYEVNIEVPDSLFEKE